MDPSGYAPVRRAVSIDEMSTSSYSAQGSADRGALSADEMDDIVERVIDKIERRVVDELERRGRHYTQGIF